MEIVATNSISDTNTVIQKPHEFSELLLCSSVIFITNVLSTYYYGDYVYCVLFCGLTGSSLMFHYNSNIYTYIIDKICILGVVSYGGYVLYNNSTPEKIIHVSFAVFLFTVTIFLYCYGYWVKDYCYHPDKCIGDKYHCMLHIISSFGHHLVLVL